MEIRQTLISGQDKKPKLKELNMHTHLRAAISKFVAARQASSQGQNHVSRLKVRRAQLPTKTAAPLASPSPLRHRVAFSNVHERPNNWFKSFAALTPGRPQATLAAAP